MRGRKSDQPLMFYTIDVESRIRRDHPLRDLKRAVDDILRELGPRFDAAYLLVDGGHAAFIDSGTNHAVPRLLETLDALGLAREAVDYVIPTHVHLDHAGGVGLLMQSLPAATLICHPRGLRHLVDPSQLWASATAVYGAEEMARSYGLSGWQLYREVILPGALPGILVGVRFSLGLMWVILIVAETISAQSGIGYMTMNAREFLQTDVVLVGILLYALLGKLADLLSRGLERYWLRWHPGYAAA